MAGRPDLRVAVTIRVKARGTIKEAAKEKEKGKDDFSPLLRLPLRQSIFLLVSAVNDALMALDVVNCDTMLKSAVNKIMKCDHAVNIILEQK